MSTRDVEDIVGEHDSEAGLQRNLSNRHIQLIAIGGAIGTGLFMGSGRTISLAGPSVLLVYLIIGFVLFFVMRAMGELLLSNHSYATFSEFVEDILGPDMGFFVGWIYWLCWIVTATAEVITIVGYIHFWWPGVPSWIPALATVALLYALNALTVKAFGEVEFWFSMIKIVAIIALIVIGIGMVLTRFTSPDGTVASLTHLWDHGGFFPNGFDGFVAGFQIAIFAFVGIELVGTTAAETKDPETSLPKAINSIPVRILLFYVGALTAIMIVTPWDSVDPEMSPFVTMFSLVGLAGAASVVNAIVLTSAASSCNSGVYSTSRMLFSLARNSAAPEVFHKLSPRLIPRNALLLTCVLLLSSIVLMAFGGSVMQAFTMVTTVASILFMFVWLSIVVAYIRYRRTRPQLHASSTFRMPGGSLACGLVIVFIGLMLVALWGEPETRVAMIATFVFFLVLGAVLLVHRRRSAHADEVAAYKQRLARDREAAAQWRATHH
ncbi:amino acid permease [Nanchangia anserum]|uniref:Amino acid permease n=1 Tax=Nanchangia anserum TaxID=2692125 RepID=A0A8I0GD59_9ACTO|nr:amino acid permease [Nanchangia anserum]MBD3689373.1 amino acid permease [Nanchangia anserum]QOX81580.1 amino acid permease [Nanchangia anserum]